MRGLALALAIIGLVTAVALVDRPTAVAQQGSSQRGALKVCRATNNEGRMVTWGCGADQRCCFNEGSNMGYCSPVGGRC